MLDFGRFEALTFDCYGTLIDWEAGLAQALLDAAPGFAQVDVDALLERYAVHEAAGEGGSYLSYRAVLAAGLRGVAADFDIDLDERVVPMFSESVRDWPAFPDSEDALRRLGAMFKLGVITNCDADLFAASNARLGVTFDWVVTAEAARAYKPSPRPFELAFATLDVPRDRILHVAQSLYHDHVPTARLGLTSVWIDRRHGRDGGGATPPAQASPAATFASMAEFADAATAR